MSKKKAKRILREMEKLGDSIDQSNAMIDRHLKNNHENSNSGCGLVTFAFAILIIVSVFFN